MRRRRGRNHEREHACKGDRCHSTVDPRPGRRRCRRRERPKDDVEHAVGLLEPDANEIRTADLGQRRYVPDLIERPRMSDVAKLAGCSLEETRALSRQTPEAQPMPNCASSRPGSLPKSMR
jgi:hypothetical protein